jgi:pimeloyl-ACP methyl ester carboxylesterase
VLRASGAALAALGLAGVASGAAAAGPAPVAETTITASAWQPPSKPNIVLVHGAWADGSSWGRVIRLLLDEGYPCFAVPLPLASLAGDVAITRAFFASQAIAGPTVLVAHSYGGAVISGAATALPQVKALVYAAAFALDANETGLDIFGRFPPPPPALAQLHVDAAGFTYIDRANFPAVFCQDVGPTEGRLLAAVQRPIAFSIFGEPAGPPAWKLLPSWYQVSTEDRVIPPDAERFMARRMGATTLELRTGHASPVSRPLVLATLIKQAARAAS